LDKIPLGLLLLKGKERENKIPLCPPLLKGERKKRRNSPLWKRGERGDLKG
jgi:hypothetical protein